MNMKINFTSENEKELKNLIADAVLNKSVFYGPIGQTYNVFELVDALSINSLKVLSNYIQSNILKLSIDDEWTENPNKEKIEELETSKRLISLIIGWKLYQVELEENLKEKVRLQKQLDDLMESQKTPEELISELKSKIEAL